MKSPKIPPKSLAKINRPKNPRARDGIYDGDMSTYHHRHLVREPQEILHDLKRLDFDRKDEFLGFWLAREKVFTTPVMIPLVEDYYVAFGGPGLARPKGRGAGGRDVHETFSIVGATGKSRLPAVVVFDIGDLCVKKGEGYESTEFRVVMDMWSKEVWIFYEYCKGNDEGAVEKNPFAMNGVFYQRTGKIFDSAKILNSIRDWNGGLEVETVEKNIKRSAANIGPYIEPALSDYVEHEIKMRKAPLKRELLLPANLSKLLFKSRIQALVDGFAERERARMMGEYQYSN
ncbi:hypothetical protein HYFRA_00002131 [Hymenoscyphus fraxineus]|uniref:Uncharacterized protein n=1 Tax=Hymenoscyphus fraxineus TaxID=746836 RepID=A0A9N9KLR2_9HELO|nr:hypothetical protein HYFRA_00002131 [Hymenoscyphus fraxineus]